MLLDILTLVSHIAYMAGPLHGWANGSFILILCTYWTTMMTIFAIYLLIGEPIWMMAPRWQRMTVFIWSLFTTSSFFAQFAIMAYGFLKGSSPFGTLAEICSFYVLLLRAADLVPSLYVLQYEGFGQNRYSIFNPKYGDWSDVILIKTDADDHVLVDPTLFEQEEASTVF